MAQDWDDRERWGRGGYGRRDDHSGRDWSDRAGDEVRSWFGDDRAEGRRRMDENRDYGSTAYGQRGGYGDDRGSYGNRSGGASGYDPYGSGRGDQGRWGEGSGYGGFGAGGPGMTGLGMGMSSYPPSLGMDRDRSDYSGRGYGGRGYGQEDYRGGSDERGFLERAGDAVASWFGDEDAARRREMDAGHRGRGPRNYSRSDERVREDVSDRLSDDYQLDASDIEVKVSGGEVTLDGTVDSRFAKRHAEDLAESCAGVRHVQNNLRVKNTSRSGPTSGSFDTSGTGTTGL